MVDFKTRIFTESDNDIIGAEVIVFSDQGTRIGSIEIANAEDLNALREQLEVIDETYFDETRLNAVLANSQESTTINATSISGYSSSDLAKVSQLSGYALTNHTHVKTSITDLYNYSISCSNYNPTIDTDISVTVKVTNQAGNPVVGHTVSILKNNSSWKSGTTGSNGEFTTTYTCSEWGLTTFSANNVSLQIKVKGFKSKSMWNGTLYYDDEKVEYWVNYAPTTTLQVHNSWTDSGAFDVVPEELRPKMFVFSTTSDTRLTVRVHPDTGTLQYVNSVQMTDPIYKCILTWFLP